MKRKRYWIFSGEKIPRGGMQDYTHSTATMDDATQYIADHYHPVFASWHQIYDSETGGMCQLSGISRFEQILT